MIKNSTAGFTLVETLVSVVLLTMTIVLPYHAIQRSLSATFAARDDLIASSLAQEAIEYVRGVRDNNYLAGRPSIDWLYGLDGGTGEDNCVTANCTIDAIREPVGVAVEQCTGTCPGKELYLSNGTSLYTHQVTGAKTKYTRYIRLAPISGNPNAVRITVTVTWFSRTTHTVVLTDIITNWI